MLHDFTRLKPTNVSALWCCILDEEYSILQELLQILQVKDRPLDSLQTFGLHALVRESCVKGLRCLSPTTTRFKSFILHGMLWENNLALWSSEVEAVSLPSEYLCESFWLSKRYFGDYKL